MVSFSKTEDFCYSTHNTKAETFVSAPETRKELHISGVCLARSLIKTEYMKHLSNRLLLLYLLRYRSLWFEYNYKILTTCYKKPSGQVSEN